MDHLKFCYEYSATHFRAHSPRVLLLHSILGVATNYFPMKAELLPKLQGMLTDFENTHVEAFPSILRLLNHERTARRWILFTRGHTDGVHQPSLMSHSDES